MLENYRQISELHSIDLSAIQDNDLVLLAQRTGADFKTRTVDMHELKACIADANEHAKVDSSTLKALNGFIVLGKVRSAKVLDSKRYPYPCLDELSKMSIKDLGLKSAAYLDYAAMTKTQYDALQKKNAKCIYFTETDKEMITVFFNYNGQGSTSPSGEVTRTIEKGTAIGELPQAARVGYYFVGWFTERQGGELVTPTTIIERTTLLYAQWMSEVIHFDKVGDIKLKDGIASGFGTSSYLQTTDDINFGKPLTIVIHATTGANVISNQEVFGMTQPDSNLEFGAYDSKFMWEVATGQVTTTQTAVSPNTTYWWKVVKDGSLVTCYCKTDTSEEWIQDYQRRRESNVVGTAVIGYDADAPLEYWRGTIDVESSYVEMDGRKFTFLLRS